MWARLSVNLSAAISGTFVAMAVIAAGARRCLRDHSCRDGCNAAGLGSHTCTPRSSPNDSITDTTCRSSWRRWRTSGRYWRHLRCRSCCCCLLRSACWIRACGSPCVVERVGQLVGWGIAVGRRLGWSWPRALVARSTGRWVSSSSGSRCWCPDGTRSSRSAFMDPEARWTCQGSRRRDGDSTGWSSSVRLLARPQCAPRRQRPRIVRGGRWVVLTRRGDSAPAIVPSQS